ncbi:hypothetical protein M0805_005938 [Coniferiporia weirii]|nr:hypothetical protein M0805_005938 [Coniferiporia weirii]
MADYLPLVLITGSTGYLGSGFLQQALEAGYPVRMTVHSTKVDVARQLHGEKVDIVVVEDSIGGDFTGALKGVGAVIYIASPTAVPQDAQGPQADSTVKAVANIVIQAVAAGVKRIVAASTPDAVNDLNAVSNALAHFVFDDQHWNPVRTAQVVDRYHHLLWISCGEKAFPEREMWKFVDEHPEMDLAPTSLTTVAR